MHDNQNSQGMDKLELIFKFKSVYYVDSIIFLDLVLAPQYLNVKHCEILFW